MQPADASPAPASALSPFVRRFAAARPDFGALVTSARQLATCTPGGLSVKHKLLVALALDVAAYAEGGVRTLSARAREAGATEEEILDVLQICYSTAGLQRLAAGAAALPGELP